MNALRKAFLVAAAAAAVLALSGCVKLNSAGSVQSQSMGPLTLTVTGCVGGSPSCNGESNTGDPYEFIQDSDELFSAQALFAVRLPADSVAPQTLNGSYGAAPLSFTRNAGFESSLQALEPAPAGERWWGWLSGTVTYSKSSANSVSASLTATLPRPADGGPLESPMHWRPTLGVRYVHPSSLPAARPVNCGNNNTELFEGFNEGGSSITTVCIDSPAAAAARGFLGANLIDFGILGTTVQAPAGSTVTAPFIAKRSGGPSPTTVFTLAAESGVPGGTLSLDRATVSLGGDATQPVLATIGVPAGTAPGSYPVTINATSPGKPTRSATVTVVVPGSPGAGPPAANVAPKIEAASLTSQRFRARKPKKAKGGPPVGAKLKVTLSEPATLSIKIERGKRRPRKSLGTPIKILPQGQNTIPVGGRLLGTKLTPGRYHLTLTAKDSGGLSSAPKTLSFSLVP